MSNPIASVQTILTSYFIKYNRLTELMYYMYQGSKATEINLYIDLYGVIKTLFSDTFRTDISDYTATTSTILNMCGHYRTFFRRLGVNAKIYLILSYNVCDINRKFVAGYNETFYKKMQNKTIKEMIDLNCNLLETICPFLQDIYFLQTGFESSVLIDHLISMGDSSIPNLILSKDVYPMQLTELHPNTSYIKPKKFGDQDNSVCITQKDHPAHITNFWDMYCNHRINVSFHSSNMMIHPVNSVILSALSRYPERNYKSILNITSAHKAIYDIVGSESIKVSMESIAQFGNAQFPVQIADARYKALDVEFFRGIYNDSVESKMISLIDLEDPASVNAICAEYFQKNPVDLSKL